MFPLSFRVTVIKMLYSCRLFDIEPVERFSATQVQKQQRLAKAVGGVHQLLPILLQVVPGRLTTGQSATAWL